MSKKIINISLLVISTVSIALSQGPPDDGFPIDEIPVDGGLEWLGFAGLLYGARILLKKIKK